MREDVAENTSNSESNARLDNLGTDTKATGVPRAFRLLLVAAVVMGVMIVLGTIILIWTIAHRMLHPHAVVPVSTDIIVPQGTVTRLSVPLHEGERIVSVSSRSDRLLAVTVARPDGPARVLLWLPEQARLVAELDLIGAQGNERSALPVPQE